MVILEATPAHLGPCLCLAAKLWADYTFDELFPIISSYFQMPQKALFLAQSPDGVAIAFMALSLRHEYVPGADHRPVAYLEGIYVKDSFHRQGIGTALVRRAEQWAREQRCRELASDALLENVGSQQFHAQLGFEEVERTVAFIKVL